MSSYLRDTTLAKKILIIDDDLIFVKIYESLFQSEGFVVDVAHDAKSAMDQLIGARPDLVLLDLFLGKVNGVHVLKEIRSRPTIRSIPVIVLSTSRTSRLVDAAWRAGANRCLWKDDFDPDQVLDVVNGTLSPGESLPETLSGRQTIDESLDSDSIQPSPLNTLTQAVSFLGKLLDGAAHKHINAYPQVTVLAVDDDQTSRWMIRSGLNLAGLKPICIGDPRIALSICEENAADLICIDAAMPGMNGFELCSRIRDFPINKNSSVLFVTGYGDFESRVRSSRAGGDDFIAKPFLLNELGLKALVHILDGQL
ncbi:MAG: response regulator [Verrucomicrobia bacterium]|nr:response regulator [Verrucomicrobiota bacterium]